MRVKTTFKTLRLNAETLRQLDRPELESVAGGATTVTIYSCLPRCNSHTTCTTNFC